jgi:YD repeat-containing protein
MILLDRLTPSKMVSMARPIPVLALMLLLAPLAACGDDAPDNPTSPDSPISVTEKFEGTLTPNGGITHPFGVQRAGIISAKLTALTPDDTVIIGMSLGTWNGSTCQLIITNDKAAVNNSVTGTAQQTGQFCVRVYDASGALTAATDYAIDVTHF